MSATPGPWEAYFGVGAGWSVRRKEPRGPDWTGLAPICSMAWFQFPIPGVIDETISEANARLVASAPDLLAALQWYVDNDETNESTEQAWDNKHWLDGKRRAEAAIAKATKGAGT